MFPREGKKYLAKVRGIPKADKNPNKKFLPSLAKMSQKVHRKSLDKSQKIWYNIYVIKRTGTSLINKKMGGVPTAKPKGRKETPWKTK